MFLNLHWIMVLLGTIEVRRHPNAINFKTVDFPKIYSNIINLLQAKSLSHCFLTNETKTMVVFLL